MGVCLACLWSTAETSGPAVFVSTDAVRTRDTICYVIILHNMLTCELALTLHHFFIFASFVFIIYYYCCLYLRLFLFCPLQSLVRRVCECVPFSRLFLAR